MGHEPVLRRARNELAAPDVESAGAGSGLVPSGPVARHLRAADAALGAGTPSATGRADGGTWRR
ncbi:hypothetical protein [Streptomyces sp. NPDC059788]|uniref:hypothetical protein n=1 Tax=Streptomyces sp. NPDC059788 TaxID=3346948 RepID=UPI00365ABD89